MKALVTGCSGFIGSNLTDRLLKDNFQVIGIDSLINHDSKQQKKLNIKNALQNKNFSFIKKDIFKMKRFPEVDYVFHLAARTGVRDSWGRNFSDYVRDNVDVTQRLLEFYKDFKIRKFVYSSSSSVYGDSELPMNEKSILKPISPYGVTKLAAENLCYLYWKTYNIPTVSLRYFTVYGPRQRPDMVIHKFVKSIINENELFIYGNGVQTRDFTYVDDVVNAIIWSATLNSAGDVFNVGGGSRISINNLLKEIEKIIGEKAKVKYLEKAKGDVKDTWADLYKIKEVLRWYPKFDIKTGLNEYINWYKYECEN
ncbi:MAG: NAD-dependent epimerase/dehydratase family protein [Methanobacterium sp.]|jgi:nucleoside-diphosphate-sugar epimerase